MEDIIKNYLDEYSLENDTFNKCFQNEHRDIDGCIEYINNKAKAKLNGRNGGIKDVQVYHWAREYYELDDEQLEKVLCKSTKTHDIDDSDNIEEIPKKIKKAKPTKGVCKNQISLFGDI